MNILLHITEFLKVHKKAALCIITHTEGSLPRKSGTKMLVSHNGAIMGTVGGGILEKQVIEDALHVIKSGKALTKSYHTNGKQETENRARAEVYIEVVGRTEQLFIFGAGHVGKALASFALKTGFEITLVDFREPMLSPEEKHKIRVLTGNYFEKIPLLEFDDNTFVAVMTPDHEDDFALLKILAKKPCAYLGMIGSHRKAANARKLLVEGGHLSEEEFHKIDTPMGIAMAAETPEEIAISVLAKMIDIRNSRKEE